MTKCTVIIHRHSGVQGLKFKPSHFAANRLKPLIEKKMAVDGRLHVIHDRIHSIKVDGLTSKFEEALGKAKNMREWKKIEKAWMREAKQMISSADRGEESVHLNCGLYPEAALIIGANRQRARTVVNHLNFYPFDSVVEYTRHKIHLSKAQKNLNAEELTGALDHTIQSNNALASSNLLKDVELLKQIEFLGEDVVVLRGLGHVYLAELEQCDTPIVTTGATLDFHELLRRKGIELEVIVEPVQATFTEEIISLLCGGGVDAETHRRFAILQVMFDEKMSSGELPEEQEDRIATAHAITLRKFNEMYAEAL